MRFASERRPARRDRAHPRAARPAGRRAQPDGRRPPRRRLARQRRDPAARGRRAGALDPPLRAPPVPTPTSWSPRAPSPRSFATCWQRRSAERRSVLISGGTGSGKTTLLNALSAFIGPAERVVTIEDAAELRLRQPHVVRLESRPASVEGRGEVTIRDLLRNALRMRPDRIVIGEVRGAEALDLLTALNTGHDGALSTVHANSPEDALRRLETLALMAGVGLPHEAIREQVRRGIELVVHLARGADGARRVVEVGEVVSAAGGVGVREAWTPVSGGIRGDPGPPGGRGGRAGGGRRSRGRPRQPGPRPLARGGGGAAAPGGPRGLRAHRRRAAPARRARDRRARSLAVVHGVGPGRRRSWRSPAPAPRPGRCPAAGRATGARSSAGCRRSRPRSPTRSRGGRSRARRARLPPRRRSRARRRPSWPACGPTSSSARRRRTRLGALQARLRSTRVDAFAAALLSPAARRRRPRRAAAAVRRRPRPSATGSPRTPARPPRRPGSPVCWSSRCRPAPRSSPS